VTSLTGQQNPLDSYSWNSSGPAGIKEYYIKVVPVMYTNVNGVQVSSNQYSVTEHWKHAYDGFPAVYIMCGAIFAQQRVLQCGPSSRHDSTPMFGHHPLDSCPQVRHVTLARDYKGTSAVV
jgi:hypothetical protein